MSIQYSRIGPKVTPEFLEKCREEGIDFDSGRLWLVFTLKNFRGPGVYAWRHKRLSRGEIILTRKRLIAIAGGHKLVDISRDHELMKYINIDRTNRKRFTLQIDLEKFPSGLTGMMSISYFIPHFKVPL